MNINDLLMIIGDKEVQLLLLRAEYKKLVEHHGTHEHHALEESKGESHGS
jgi:hypothetical protein